MPILKRFPRFISGHKTADQWYEMVAAELEAARNIIGPGVLRRPDGAYINPQTARGASIYFRITGTCGFDGGYPYQPLTQNPIFSITPGTGYTTITLTPGAGPSGSTAPTLVGVLSGGKLTGVTVTSDGSGWYDSATTPTVSVTGDGAGALVTVNGVTWRNNGSSLGRVYEVQGNRGLGATGTVYRSFPGPTGLPLFLAPSIPTTKFAKSPVTGIPARSSLTLGSATCTYYTVSPAGVKSLSAIQGTVYNDSTTAVGNSKDIIVISVDGLPTVLAEDC